MELAAYLILKDYCFYFRCEEFWLCLEKREFIGKRYILKYLEIKYDELNLLPKKKKKKGADRGYR